MSYKWRCRLVKLATCTVITHQSLDTFNVKQLTVLNGLLRRDNLLLCLLHLTDVGARQFLLEF